MQEAETTQVVIFTKNFRIVGKISLYAGGRLTDYMNKTKSFIAVTSATVSNHDGKELTSGSFLNLNVDQIEIIMPRDGNS